MADNTEKKQGFQKGQSGNPYGRPKGALNKTTRACQELLNGEAETITRKAIEMAVGGDMTALKLCLERIVPVRKEAPVVVTLPSISRESDLAKFTAALLEAVTKGDITISKAQGLLALAMIHVEKGLDKKDFMGGLGLPWP